MVYMTQQRGAYFFQMRVPRKHRAEFGELIRVQLNTHDREVARVLSMALAAQWLARFSGLQLPAILGGAMSDRAPPELSVVPAVGQSPERTAPTAPAVSTVPEVDTTPVAKEQTFFALFEYWRDLNPNRPLRTVIAFEATAKDFDGFVNRPVSGIDRRIVAAYRDSLLKTALHPKTVTKKLGHLGAILQAAVDAGLQEVNPVRGLRVPRQEGQSAGRRPFTSQELEQVFSSPVFSERLRPRAGGGEACAWLPALGLLTGCRLEELCQLRVRDVELDPMHGLLLHIRPDGLTVRVKNDSSIRIVPVHPELERIGLRRYLDIRRSAGDEWLFPQLVPDRFSKRSGNWSKWWGRYLREDAGCGIKDRGLVFHAFRHTFKTLCRAARIPEDVHDALTGHSNGHIGRHYGTMPIDVLVASLRSIEPPIRLPLIQSC